MSLSIASPAPNQDVPTTTLQQQVSANAGCAGRAVDDFFHGKTSRVGAMRLCGACPVVAECRELQTRSDLARVLAAKNKAEELRLIYGVFGAQIAADRREEVRARLRTLKSQAKSLATFPQEVAA
ncbi:WhiB family transcriptional regulator [Nonomuraea sp. NPDC050328]|uniref:WhiB family transcriptional regulator n=1 Tax=Nonomuraea sp. NPDC050328 TaxID=3364361 RepID=UPI00379B5B66